MLQRESDDAAVDDLRLAAVAVLAASRSRNALKNSLNHSECPPTMITSASCAAVHDANSHRPFQPLLAIALFPRLKCALSPTTLPLSPTTIWPMGVAATSSTCDSNPCRGTAAPAPANA